MAIVVKTAPIGVDYYIDKLQRYLYSNLAWSNYESYHRGYRNPKEDNFIPEVYVGEDQYKEVFFDDRFSATSYFLLDEENPIENSGVQPTVSLYYQVKLDQIKPAITHRPDEEVLNEVLFWIKKSGYGIKATSVISGIPNVYAGLKQDQVQFDNMNEFYVFRIVLDFPIVAPDFCPGVVVPVCADAIITDGENMVNVASGGTYTCTSGSAEVFLKALFSTGNDTMETLTIDADNAATYTSIADDGASGTITLDINGGGFGAFVNPTVLGIGDTLIIKRTVTTASGFVKLST
jgi:hypothetical protein